MTSIDKAIDLYLRPILNAEYYGHVRKYRKRISGRKGYKYKLRTCSLLRTMAKKNNSISNFWILMARRIPIFKGDLSWMPGYGQQMRDICKLLDNETTIYRIDYSEVELIGLSITKHLIKEHLDKHLRITLTGEYLNQCVESVGNILDKLLSEKDCDFDLYTDYNYGLEYTGGNND